MFYLMKSILLLLLLYAVTRKDSQKQKSDEDGNGRPVLMGYQQCVQNNKRAQFESLFTNKKAICLGMIMMVIA